jgi:hypothetical protein
MKKAISIFCLVISYQITSAQPGSEIYLFDLKIKRDKVTLNNPRNITNHKGYDNQPFFHPDKPILYYVSADQEGRTDIIEYNYRSAQTRKLTQTPEKEYSPTVTPDKQFISCIIQRDNGAQDLGKYPIDGGQPQVLINNLIVGYHAWADAERVAVFILPQPFKLHLIDLKQKTDTVMAEQIARSLHKIPGEKAISFIQKVGDNEWTINKLEPETMKISEITKSLPGREHDMAWAPSGIILMSDEKKLFFYEPGNSLAWREVDYQSAMPAGTLTRIAVNAKENLLALVISED